jgi:hypothetical protein
LLSGRRRSPATTRSPRPGPSIFPNGSDFRGLSLYRVVNGRVAEAHHAIIGPPPGEVGA